MAHHIHPNATTTPRIRAAIQAAPPEVSHRALARQYGISVSTVRHWRYRDTVEDGSHRPHHLKTTLNPAQEAVVVELRRLLELTLDDLLVVVREFIHPTMSRSALDRLLQRHGVGNIDVVRAENRGEDPNQKRRHKDFKAYEPGFIHVDVKYLPALEDTPRRYLFVAIDRATRWVYLEVRRDKSARSARAFLAALIRACPVKIHKILTDNGKEFTDRFTATGEREPTGHHPFDALCREHDIEHRLIPPRRPQTNGMVERFNGRIADILRSHHFESNEDLEATLRRYAYLYNYHIPQRALGHKTPIEVLREWQEKNPELFVKNVRNHPGPDRAPTSGDGFASPAACRPRRCWA